MQLLISIDIKKLFAIRVNTIIKSIIGILSLIFLEIAYTRAELPTTIVALVNNEPITSYDFEIRKNLIATFNHLENLDAKAKNMLDQAVINSLIDEQLLFQYSKKLDIKVSDADIEEAIATIAERNKLSKESFYRYLSSIRINIDSFRRQISAELIKLNILSHISRSVKVTSAEIDTAILLNNSKEAKVSILVFTSKDKTKATLQKMYNLHKNLKTCGEIKEMSSSNFATNTIINENLSNLDSKFQSIVKDLDINQKSSVLETPQGFQIILVCNKVIDNITPAESDYIINFITNKKTLQKTQKFFEDLRKKAYIKIML